MEPLTGSRTGQGRGTGSVPENIYNQLMMSEKWLDSINWTPDGLVPVIAQDAVDGTVLMFAWMNRESLGLTVREGRAIYWSRSRGKLWRKGEESGHVQLIKDIRLDCDNDVVLLLIEQKGGIACHTGRRSCFFQKLEEEGWVPAEPVLKDPQEIYKSGDKDEEGNE